MTERKCFVFKFADVEVKEREFLLIKAGERIPIEPKAFRVLLFLLRNPGRLISKDEIVGSVWNDSAVSDNSLTRSIAQLRRVLGDDSREPLYILTVPTVGYRFLCEVSSEEDGFGISTESPRDETHKTDENRHCDQGPVEGALPLSLEKPEAVSGRSTRPRGLLFVAVGAGAVLVVVAGFLIPWAIGRKSVSEGHAIAYPLIERRVTSNPSETPVHGAAVSPDGKYVAYGDPTGLYLRQLSTGETRPWTLPKGFEAWPGSWFPDGAHLLVLRTDGTPGADGTWRPSIYKLPLLGGEPQKIMDNAARGTVSPDGSRIAYLPGPSFGGELRVMDADGTNSRKVVSATTRGQQIAMPSRIWNFAWSPNGKRLAYIELHYVAGPSPVWPTSSLQTIDLNGGKSSTVVLDDSRIGESLWWAPDGRILFAYREDQAGKKDNYGVYSIQVDERSGQAAGTPQAITQAEGKISGLSATADGKRLVLWRSNSPLEVFIAKRDGRQWKEPRRLTLDSNDNIADQWTLDSKAVLFVSNRNGTWKLFKQEIDKTTPQVLVEGPGISLPRLSADGTQVLYLSAPNLDDLSFPASLMSKPLAGGPPHLVLQEKGIINLECAQAPSKLCLFSNLAGNDLIFHSFDLERGAGREVVRIPNGYSNWSISPDGSKLAVFLDQHHIRVISTETALSREVTVKDWNLHNGDWSADGKTIYAESSTPKGIPVVLEIDQAGKANVVLEGNANTQFWCLYQSPDGQYGLLLEQIPAENNAWMIDNF